MVIVRLIELLLSTYKFPSKQVAIKIINFPFSLYHVHMQVKLDITNTLDKNAYNYIFMCIHNDNRNDTLQTILSLSF